MPRSASTIGLHGHEVLGLLYRYGCLTLTQLQRLTDLSESGAKRQLGYLIDAGYVARARDVAGWQKRSTGRPKTAYYLTVPNGAKAGAFSLGIENDYLALRHYRRVRLPGTVAHRLLSNEYLLAVREAGDDAVPDEEIFSEASPGLPLYGTGTPKSERADSPFKYTRVVPDATWTVSGQTYFLETETRFYGRPELTKKLSDYAGRWRRKLRPKNVGEKKHHDPSGLEPVVILTPTDEAADRLHKYLRERLPDSEEWASAAEAIRAASIEDGKPKATPGMLVLFAGFEEIQNDPLARVYTPLRKYTEALVGADLQRVSLQDAAAVSQKITVPAKPEPEALEGLEDDDKKKDEESAA